MEIYLIATTTVDWERFVTICNKSLGRSPTRKLDSMNLRVGTLKSFLGTLDSFNLIDVDPNKPNEFTLQHVSLSFLIIVDKETYYEFLEKCQLKIVKCTEYISKYDIAFIASGTLKDWKESIINFNSIELWDIFSNMNLGFMFNEYKIENNEIEKR